MTTRENLIELYQEWRRLSEAEGEAIRQAAWNQVGLYQTAKRNLQPQIVTITEQYQEELPSSGPERAEEERFFRHHLRQLIELEVRNGDSIDAQRRQAEADKVELDQSARNLRELRRYYAPMNPPHWQSLS